MEEKTALSDHAEPTCCCGSGRTRVRTEEELRLLTSRLSRIEGQIRGIKGMLERDAYCVDILNQVSAAGSALNSFARVLLELHMRTCVTDDIKAGNTEKMDELLATLQKLMK